MKKNHKVQVNKSLTIQALQSYRLTHANSSADQWKYLIIISVIYQRQKAQYFNNKNVITLVRVEKGEKVDCAQIIFNSLCSELDQWYKYVKDNKGDKKDTCQFALVLVKIFQYLLMHQKEGSQKPSTKVLKTKEEM